MRLTIFPRITSKTKREKHEDSGQPKEKPDEVSLEERRREASKPLFLTRYE